MKRITEHINDAMGLVNEAKMMAGIVSSFDAIGDEFEAREEAHQLDAAITKLEMLKPNDLKKIRDWKDFEDEKLRDYCKIIELCAGYCWGVQSQVDDEAGENYDYFIMTLDSFTDGQEWCGYDQTLDNMDNENFEYFIDDASKYAALDDILAHWNDLSKAIFHRPWN